MSSGEGRHDPRGRVEDLRLLTGRGSYVDDRRFENQAFLGIVRSPYAHARIKSIDFSKVSSSPEFISSLTGEDLLKKGVRPLTQLPMQKPANRYHLAVKKVRYAGEAVAAILVKSKNSLEDLIDDVEVEYEELPVVSTISESKLTKTLLYEDWQSNIAFTQGVKRGDAEHAIASAPYVVRTRIGIARQAGTPIEPRAVLVSHNGKNDLYDVYATVQSAQRLQGYLASELQLPKERFHVRVMDVGGGFGTKGAQSYPEYALACIFSKDAGVPVKWTSTRTEDLLETASGRDEYCNIALACDQDGKILALKADLESDAGVSGSLSIMAGLSLRLIPGSYRIPNLDLKATAYVTNKGPLGPVRGAGRPEACFFIERAVDLMAKKTTIDPIEFRRRNAILPGEFPYDNGAGFIYDGGNFPLLLDTLVKASGYSDLLESRSNTYRKFKLGEESVLGIGVCLEVEDTGAQLSETARIVFEKNGMVKVFTGSSPHGQGLETTLAQLCSEELGIPLDRVTVVWGDTDLIPVGVGTFGSRSAVTGGSSVVEAARKLKLELITNASKILAQDPKLLEIRNGSIVKSSEPDHVLLTLSSILEKLNLDEISAVSNYKLDSLTFASGAHLCVLMLDTETGKVRITKYVAVDDCGRVINEAIVDGQIHGGVVHGIGGSIFEQLVYDEEGRLLSSNFLDYTIPSSVDSPDIEVVHVETPSTIALNGAKGVGESGTIAAYPAVINALNDALSQVVPDMELNLAPATPEVVLSVLNRPQKG